jgi:hypothetical protein
MSNPNGIGGFKAGQPAANPGGRPRSATTAQLFMLRYFREAAQELVRLMREGTKNDVVRLAAIKEILDRGLGKAPQAVSLDLTMGQHLRDMSPEELREFKARYVAATTMAPTLIDQVVESETEYQPEMDLESGEE